MLTLALDTSTAVGSVALLREGRLVAEATTRSTAASPRTKAVTHSTNLVPAVERLLADCGVGIAECDLFAVGLGPGSFTGIRVAIATAQGFALACGKPVVGVSSMDALALANQDRLPTGCTTLAVVVDAGRGEVYCSTYSVLDGQFFKVNDPAIVAIKQLRSRILSPAFFIGPEVERFRADLEGALGVRALVDARAVTPGASTVGLLAEEKFAERQMGDSNLEPIYLRPPIK
jgi:tRNA threonylcarbamoyladenosine biosynthesis protein TsaB